MKLNTLPKLKLLLLSTLLFSLSSTAQTTLSAGDLMIIGVNSDPAGSPTADEFVVLFLEPVSAGTEIYFTDMGYVSNSSPFFQTNLNNGCPSATLSSGAVSDGMIKWTAPTGGVSAGTQVVFRVKVTGGVPTVSVGTVSIVVQTQIANEGLNFSGGGDVIFAFQGTINGSNQVSSMTLISSLNYDANWVTSLTTCQYTSGDSKDPGGSYNIFFTTHADNGYYNGSLSGTKAALQAAILNFSNWTTSTTTTYTFPIVAPVTSTTWNGTTWSNGAPSATVDAVIASSNTVSSFTCKNLTINSGVGCVIGAGNTVNINGDVTNNGLGLTATNQTGVANFASSGQLLGNSNSFNGTLTVASGATLTTNNKLTLISLSNNTARIGNSAGTISGNVTVQRYIPGKRAYRFFSHPFTTTQPLSILTDDIDITGAGGSANGFTTTTTNNPSAYYWNPATANNTTAGNNPGWSAATSASSSTWAKGALARVLVRGTKNQGLTGGSYTPSAATLDMTGAVNQGTQTITLTKGASSNYVACGNPFPCAVQMNTVAKGANIGSSYYVWDATSGTKGAYVTKLFTDNYVLPEGAALFTTASANSGNTLVFEEADKVTSGDASIFKTTAAKDIIELSIADSNIHWDVLSFRFNDQAQAVKEYNDATKLNNPGLDFFTYSADNKELAIDSRPYVDGAVIPLGLTAYKQQQFVIRAKEFNIPAGTKVYFHDKFLNKKVLMDASFEYWFEVTADANSQGKRFELNTEGTPTSIITATNNGTTMQLVPNPATNQVNVVFHKLEGKAQVKVMSVTGQVVHTQAVHTTIGSVMIPLQNIPAGIYIVELESNNARFVERLIKQ